MLRMAIRVLLIWIRSLVWGIGIYLAITLVTTFLITGLYYGLLLVVTNEAWAQIALTAIAIVVGIIAARYVYVRNQPYMLPDKVVKLLYGLAFFAGGKL